MLITSDVIARPNDDTEVLLMTQFIALVVSTEPVSLRVLLEIAIATRAVRDTVRLRHVFTSSATCVDAL